jgi:hypothetical protein
MGVSERRGPLRSPRLKCEHNIKMDLRETGWGDIGWVDLDQARDRRRALVDTVMDLRVPYKFGKLLNSCTTLVAIDRQ